MRLLIQWRGKLVPVSLALLHMVVELCWALEGSTLASLRVCISLYHTQ